jgi:NAD(P)-dependent dehydrogenase (short-subunit alcohol dehydrogenase family)
MFDFTDKVVIVTGGGKGIGKEITLSFAQAGAKISIWEMDLPAAKEVVAEITGNGGQAIALNVDVTSQESVEAAVAETLQAFSGRIDVLVNNAGLMLTGDNSKVLPETPDQCRKVVEVNLIGPYICSWAVFPIMIKQKYGRIINIASISAQRISVARTPCYSASKAGVLGLTRHLAMEGGAWGIRVNAINPGATLTPMWESTHNMSELEERAKKIPTGRLSLPQDHANLAMFLASDLAEQITGQAIDCEGGQLIYWLDRDTYFKDVK